MCWPIHTPHCCSVFLLLVSPLRSPSCLCVRCRASRTPQANLDKFAERIQAQLPKDSPVNLTTHGCMPCTILIKVSKMPKVTSTGTKSFICMGVVQKMFRYVGCIRGAILIAHRRNAGKSCTSCGTSAEIELRKHKRKRRYKWLRPINLLFKFRTTSSSPNNLSSRALSGCRNFSSVLQSRTMVAGLPEKSPF